jgi:transposase-like protein
MAVAGDIMIKLAADFADFSTGMDAAAAKLDQLGEQVSKTAAVVQNFVETMKQLGVGATIEQMAEKLLAFAESTQKVAANISTMAAASGLSTDALQAYQFAAVEAGQKTDAVVSTVEHFNRAMAEASQGSRQQITALNELGVKIIDANGKYRANSDVLTEVAQKLQKMPESVQKTSIEMALFGRAGEQANGAIDQLSKGLSELEREAESAGYIMDRSLIAKADELEKHAALAEKRLQTMVAAVYLPLKTTILDTIADGITAIQRALQALDISKLELIVAIATGQWSLVGAIAGAGIVGARAPFDSQDYVNAANKAAQLTDHMKALQSSLNDAMRTGNKILEERMTKLLEEDRQQLASQQSRMQMAMGAARTQAEGIGVPRTLPDTSGATNPAARGGGGQHHDRVSETLQKWRDQTEEAAANLRLMQSSESKTADEAEREYQIRKRIADLTVPLRRVDPSRANEIDSTANQMVKAEDAAKRWEKAISDADRTMTKFGDGSRTMQKGVEDLIRQLQTGYLSTTAFNKALQELQNNADKQRSAIDRLQGGFKGFTAGLEDSRKALEKSSDAYALGEATFNGLINAMNEGLLALEGQSKKSFGQIALDFVNMLAQMAEKAAASMVFKWLLSSLGGSSLFGSSDPTANLPIDQQIAIWSSYGGTQNRQSGGPVYPGMPYIVGETGPERFVPSTTGSIQPLGAGSSNGASATVNVAMSGQAPPSPRAAADFARKVKSAVVDQIANEQRPGGTLYSYGGVRA